MSFFCYNHHFYNNFSEIKSSKNSFPFDSDFIHYGYGVFTSLLYFNGKIFFLEDHLQRLKKSCDYWQIKYKKISASKIHELVSKNITKDKSIGKLTKAKIKIIFFRDNFKNISKVNYLIFFSPIKEIKEVFLEDNDTYNYNEIDRHKTCNYMNAMRNVKIVKKTLFDTVKKNYNNKILETTIGNIALIKKNTLQLIDSTKNIILDGVFQKKLVENYHHFFDKILFKNGFLVKEIQNADSVLHLNSIRGVNLVKNYCGFELNSNYNSKIDEINNYFK